MNKSIWDAEFSNDEYIYGKKPNDFLKEHYLSIPKGKVLMLAEGEGRNAVFLAAKGYDVTAVDISEVALKKAEKLAMDKGVSIELICSDLETFDLGKKRWDGVVSIFCHLMPKIRANLYERIEKSLTDKGIFFLEAYTPDQLKFKTGGPPIAEMMISKKNLLKELPLLSFSCLKELERDVIEGINHHGPASVIQAIGNIKH